MSAPAQENYAAAPTERIVKSPHREQLAETLREKTFWLITSPCLCGGCGIGPLGNPCLVADGKCLCYEAESYTEDCWTDYGVCFSLEKACCCISHCACPPGGGANDGVPMFACCNMRWGGKESGEVKPESQAQLMKDAFLLYYLLCTGCGFAHCGDPLVRGSSKICCLRGTNSTADCCPDDRPSCFHKQKTCCCIYACRTPFFGSSRDGVPACAVCGQVIFGAPVPPPEQVPLAAAPAQEAMQ